MSVARIVEAIYVFEHGQFGGSACVPWVSPDQLSLDGFEAHLDGSVIVAITFATHGCFERVLAQTFLIVMRAYWRPRSE